MKRHQPERHREPTALRWLGKAWLPGVPARDLSAEEAAVYDYELLVKSGLYEPIDEPEEVDKWQE